MLIHYLKENRPLVRFLAIACGLYVSWYIVYDLLLHPAKHLDDFVTYNAINLSKKILSFLGFTVYSRNRLTGIVPTTGLWIGDPCNGLNLFALFSGFIIAYPGKIKYKLVFIPSGIIIIHIINIVRIAGLCIVLLYRPGWMNFNHTYTFTIIAYICIFSLWMLWVNKFSRRGK